MLKILTPCHAIKIIDSGRDERSCWLFITKNPIFLEICLIMYVILSEHSRIVPPNYYNVRLIHKFFKHETFLNEKIISNKLIFREFESDL